MNHPPFPKDNQMTVVHNSYREERTFVHDTMMYAFHGKIYMAWYSCPQSEIADDTMLIGRSSSDNGKTWSAPFVIARDEGKDGEPRHFVPVSFWEYKDTLYAFVSKMTRHDRPVSVSVYRLLEETTEWEYQQDLISEADDLSLILNHNALPQPDGSFLISGRFHPEKNCYPDRPCILRWQGGNMRDWQLIPLSEAPIGNCPETSVSRMEKGTLIAVTRNSFGSPALFYVSSDEGKTWRCSESDLPAIDAKLYLLTLSTGQTVIAFNKAENETDRTRLCLALLNPETLACKKMYTVAHGISEVGYIYHYPCLLEKDGLLFISCTVNTPEEIRSAAVFTIPLSNLL